MKNYEAIFIFTIPIYSLSVFFLMSTFFYQRKIKDNRKYEIVSYIIYTIFLGIVFFFVRVPIVFLSFNIISFFLISLNYKEKFMRRVIKIICIYCIFLVVELIISAFIGFFDISAFMNSQFDSVNGIILIRLVTVIVAYFIYKFKCGMKKEFAIPSYYYLIHMVILFGTLYLFLTSLENKNLSLSKVLISSMVLTFINVFIIFIEEKIYKAMTLHTERNILKIQNLAYENQAEIINESLLAIKSLKHDWRNHLLYLNSLYENNKHDEIKQYMVKTLDSVKEAQDVLQSNNFIVDSIVNWKLGKLIKNETEIELDVKIPENINILAYDLTVILGNLFDNAIDALDKVLSTEKRKLYFSMKYSKGNLIILIENSYEGKLKMKDGKFKTTKELNYEHGMGLYNVEKTVEAYGGLVQIKIANQLFSVAVLIPCTE